MAGRKESAGWKDAVTVFEEPAWFLAPAKCPQLLPARRLVRSVRVGSGLMRLVAVLLDAGVMGGMALCCPVTCARGLLGLVGVLLRMASLACSVRVGEVHCFCEERVYAASEMLERFEDSVELLLMLLRSVQLLFR